MEKFLHLLLFLHPFVLTAYGCIGVGSGCRRNLIYGGRLMLSGNTGMNFGNLPDVNGNQVFIFQTPPRMRNFLRPSAGRGQIWVGRSSCAGTAPGHCPSSETPPCLDSRPCPPPAPTTPPCSLVLDVNEKDVLTFTWERPACVPETEDLTYSYTFWMDGDTQTGTTTDTQKIFPQFYYNSKYFFEVNVDSSEGSYSDYISNASPAYADSTPLTFLAVSTSGVTVSWPFWSETTDKGLGPIAEYIIQYRLKGDSEFERFPRGLTNQYRFEGLTSGATYEFQVIIVKSNPTEEGDPSPIQEVQINCPAPTSTSLSLRSDYRSSDNSVSIYASWSVEISSFCAAGLNQTLTVQVLNRDSCDTSNQMTFNEIIMGGDVRDYTLRNTPPVLPNSEYRVTITVTNTLGTDNDMQTITTAVAVPTQPPVLLDPIVTTSPSPGIIFRWNEPQCGGRNGDISNYEYRFWQEGSSQPEPGESVVTGNTVTPMIDYNPDSRYTFSVRALTAKGGGTPDTFAVIDPPRYNDDTPLTFYDVTSGSISVRWAEWNENVGSGQGPVVEYILQYRRTTDPVFMQAYRGSDLSYQVPSLQDRGLYEFRIKLVKDNPRVEGPPSSIQQSIACAGLGGLTPQLATRRLHRGNVSLDVNWEIPSSSCDVTGQRLFIQQLDVDRCYYKGEKKEMALQITQSSHSLTGMKPNTEYNVTLQVDTMMGSFSVSDKIRTAETEPTGTPRMKEKRKVGRITFWWEPPPCGERNGDVGYYYYMVLNGESEEGKIRKGSRLKTVMGLNEGDNYMFKVRAYTSAGNGDYTSDRMKTFYLG